MDRDLTKDEFQCYHDRIYALTGIHYPSEKIELLSNRIRKRIRATGEASYSSYLQRISRGDPGQGAAGVPGLDHDQRDLPVPVPTALGLLPQLGSKPRRPTATP